MIDVLPKLRSRKKELQTSQRGRIKGYKVEYEITPSESNERFKQPGHDPHLSGDSATVPRKVKWDKKKK